jgi:SSS family solute:Na+ symporter/sodium/proline symporter
MSTLSALVLTSASTFPLDFLKGNIFKNMSEKSQLLSMRLLVVAFIFISSVIAIMQYKSSVNFIAQLMGISWGALAGAFLAPFLYGLYWRRTTLASVWVSFIFATFFMTANMFFRDLFPPFLMSPINAGAFTMLAGLIIVPIVSLISPPPDKRLVDYCFSSYDRTVTVKVEQALGSENGNS